MYLGKLTIFPLIVVVVLWYFMKDDMCGPLLCPVPPLYMWEHENSLGRI